MKQVLRIMFCMAALATPALAGDVGITIHYGNGQQMTFVGPADDTFCVARSTGLKLNAQRIDVPAGNYRLMCPEITFDPKFQWIPASQAVGPGTINSQCGLTPGPK